jgi:hypothetical protein
MRDWGKGEIEERSRREEKKRVNRGRRRTTVSSTRKDKGQYTLILSQRPLHHSPLALPSTPLTTNQ